MSNPRAPAGAAGAWQSSHAPAVNEAALEAIAVAPHMQLGPNGSAAMDMPMTNLQLEDRAIMDETVDVHQLHQLIVQRQSLFTRSSRQGVWETVMRWWRPAVFQRPQLELQHHKWAVASMLTMQKFSHMVSLILFAASRTLQVTNGQVQLSMLLFIAATAVLWLITGYLIWRKSRCYGDEVLIGLLYTLGVISSLVSSLLCTDWCYSAQCNSLSTGHFNTLHLMSVFCLNVLLASTYNLQAVWVTLFSASSLAVWLGMFGLRFSQVSTASTASTIVAFALVFAIVHYQVLQRQIMSRLQFHMVIELSKQVMDSSQAMQDIEQAHRESYLTREKELRSVLVKSIQGKVVAFMCAQLCTPLHTLKGFMQQLVARCNLGHTVDTTDMEVMAMLSQSTASLINVTADAAELAPHQTTASVAPDPVQAPFKIRPCIDRVVQDAQKQCSADCRLELDVRSNVPTSMVSDELRVDRILRLAVAYAVRSHDWSQGARLRVRCYSDEMDNASPRAEASVIFFEVWYRGRGLAGVNVQRLFEPFTTSGAESPFSCLNLPVVRALALKLGGQVGLEERGQCTVFFLKLPAVPRGYTLYSQSSFPTPRSPIHNPFASVLRSADRDGSADPLVLESPTHAQVWQCWGTTLDTMRVLRVLVVDDQCASRRLLATYLQQAGHVVTECATSSQVAHPGASAVDLLFVDTQLEAIDPLSCVRKVQEQCASVVAVAVTPGTPSPHTVQTLTAAGFDAVVAKPFTMTDLQALLMGLHRALPPVPPQ